MQSEISIFLNRPDDAVTVRRGDSLGGTSHWICLRCDDGRHAAELSVFGSPQQLDAFIDSLVALRSKQDGKLVDALRKALKMPEDSTELEVLLQASLLTDAKEAA